MIVRLKGVKTVRSKGKTYHYHRRTMTRLAGSPGSAEFLYALKQLQNRSAPAGMPGTLGSLISAYRASPEFQNLAASSQRNYQLVFDALKPNSGRSLHSITSDSLYELRDALAKVRGRTVVNRVLTVLGIVFSWGIKRGLHKGANPIAMVDKIRRPHGTRRVNRPWTDAELETVLAAAPPRLRLALTISAYTGLRESDVVLVTWSCYDGRAFETKTQKTGQRVWIPAHARLKEMLDALCDADFEGSDVPRSREKCLTGSPGRTQRAKDISHDWAEKSIVGGTTAAFRSAFYRLVRQLQVGEGLSIHGLRHTLGHKLAEAGCDPPTIAAVLGHSTSRMAEHYSRTANRDRLAEAAFERL